MRTSQPFWAFTKPSTLWFWEWTTSGSYTTRKLNNNAYLNISIHSDYNCAVEGKIVKLVQDCIYGCYFTTVTFRFQNGKIPECHIQFSIQMN